VWGACIIQNQSTTGAKRKKYKITPLEIVCPKVSQCLGNVTTPNFFHRHSKNFLGNGLVNIFATCSDVGTNSNFTSPSATFSFKK